MRAPSLRLAASLLSLALGASALGQEQPDVGGASVDDLVRREAARREVRAAIEKAQPATDNGDVQVDRFVGAAHGLVPLGADVVPELAEELAQALPDTFYLAAYALALIGGPAAEVALRDAVARAEEDPSDYGQVRKGWACYGLGLLGRADVVDLLHEGRHRSAGNPIHRGVSALDIAALFAAPDSIPRLAALLARDDETSDPNGAHRILLIRALGRIGDARALPPLAAALTSPSLVVRYHAAQALGSVAQPQTADLLLGALRDPEPLVRSGAGLGLEASPPTDRLGALVERLAVEDDPIVRGSLYRILARVGGAREHAALAGMWGRPDTLDRQQFLAAVTHAPGDWALAAVRAGLADPDPAVAVAAALALGRFRSAQAIPILSGAVEHADWARAQTAIASLARIGDAHAAAPIAHRLIDVELAAPVTDPKQRLRVEKLLEALVALGETGRLDELRTAAGRQTDPTLKLVLARRIAQLERLRRRGSSVSGWIEELDSTDADGRMQAYSKLGRTGGGERAARALAERFDRVATAEAVEILRALGDLPTPSSRALVRRVLIEPEFDPAERAAERDMAAWSARRLGGEEMLEALRAAVDRREGRDARPLLYFAVLGGRSALPALERWRLPRFRYLKWTRGVEDVALQWARREIVAGRPLARYDVPPEEIDLR